MGGGTEWEGASTVEALQVLCDEVAAGEILVGVDQPPGDVAGRLAGGKASAIEALDATNAQARRRQKTLVGGVGIVKVDVLLGERDAESAREIDRRLPAHSRQHIALPRRQQTAVAHQEDVAAEALGEIAAGVEQYRPGFGVLRLHLAVGEYEVEILVHLGARRQSVGRS